MVTRKVQDIYSKGVCEVFQVFLTRMVMLYQFSRTVSHHDKLKRKITDEMIRKARWGWTESPEDFGHMIDHK